MNDHSINYHIQKTPGPNAESSPGLRTPSARRCAMPDQPCLRAFWFPGRPDLPRIPAMYDSIANKAGFFFLYEIVEDAMAEFSGAWCIEWVKT
jgi:hypothetical protein